MSSPQRRRLATIRSQLLSAAGSTPPPERRGEHEAAAQHQEVVVIGAGFSGMLVTSALRDKGVHDVLVLEMTGAVGGVWAAGGVGAYPGAACDVPAYTYLPCLDRTKFVPSKKYVGQAEISTYCDLLVETTGIRPQIRVQRKVVDVVFVGDAPGAGDRVWSVTHVDARSGAGEERITCKFVVAASGPISSPRLPEIEGVDRFKGYSCHTALWDNSTDLKGKRVGVVGTGASAAQVITSVCDDVEHLYVMQRSPTWVLPRDDVPTPGPLRAAFEAGEGFGELLRREQAEGLAERDPNDPTKRLPKILDWSSVHDPVKNKAVCDLIKTTIIAPQVPDKDLARRLTPDYGFFCKRALFLDDYYSVFNKPNVTLVDDPLGVRSVHESGVVTGGGKRVEGLDVLIYASGFDTGAFQFSVKGRGGLDLAAHYGARLDNKMQNTRPQSLWGMHVRGFPNFLLMVGPQSLNPLTNVTQLSEQQAKRIAQYVVQMRGAKQRLVEPTEAAVARWTALCESSSEGKVWTTCNNWYMKSTIDDEGAGRERAATMWFETYGLYMDHMMSGEGGTDKQLLEFYS